MAYILVNENRKPVKFGRGDVKEHYVPAQNTDMIYIGISIAVLVLIILLYILYKKLKE